MSTNDLLINDRSKVREELGKSEADVKSDVKIIKEWLLTQRHLPEIPNDNMIEFFLTNCKYSIEKTKQNLDMYYTIRDLMPDMYRGINPNSSPNIHLAHNACDFVLLPKLTPELHRICFIRFRNDNMENSDLRKSISHYLANLYEVRIQEDLAMGDIYIADYDQLKFGHISKITPIIIKNFAFIIEKVHSGRLKAVHLINPPNYVSNIIDLFKSFLNQKLRERIFTHRSIDDLFKYIPIELLPSNYGGEEKSMEELVELWKHKLMDYKDRFDYLDEIKVNESLRPVKLQNDEILGYHGNFKKIDVD